MRSLNRLLTVCALMFLVSGELFATSTGTVAPFPEHVFLDANGDPCNACQLFVYTAGTSTKVNTYTEVTLSSANTNPIVLPSTGRATIFLTPGLSYKFVLAPPNDSDPPATPYWTVDSVGAVPPTGTATDVDITGTAGESLSAGDAVYLSDGSGGTTAGRWYKADADNTYSSSLAQGIGFATAAITSGTSGTIRVGGRITGLSGLTAGTPYYISATNGALTSTAPTNARIILQADATTAGVILARSAVATATLQGLISTGTQTIAGTKTFSGRVTISPRTPVSNDLGDHATSGTGATDVWTNGGVSLSAGAVQNGEMFVFEAYGDMTADGNTKNFVFQLGATTFTTGGLSINNASWHYKVEIMRVSASAQRVMVWTTVGGSNPTLITYTTSAENMDNALAMKLTLTHGTSGTTTARVIRAWVEPAP